MSHSYYYIIIEYVKSMDFLLFKLDLRPCILLSNWTHYYCYFKIGRSESVQKTDYIDHSIPSCKKKKHHCTALFFC
jgi:hypothetical protein